MQLQIAFDRMPVGRAVELTQALAGIADWIEVGTSLVKSAGLAAIERVVEAAAGTPVLADLKTVDDAAYEFASVFDAGASGATVLAIAADASIATACAVASRQRGEAVVDLLLAGPSLAAALATWLPAEAVLLAHTGKDSGGSAAGAGAVPKGWGAGRRVAVAGGLTLESVRSLEPGTRAVVGTAITGAPDPVAAALAFRDALNGAAE